MASPIVVELKAKADEFMSKMGDAEKQIDQLNRRGGDSMQKLSTVGKAAFLGLAGAAVGFGTVAVKAAMDQEEADARLSTALKNVGSAMNVHGREVELLSSKMRQLGFDDGDAVDSMAKLTAATKDPAKAIQDVALAADIARGRHIDLAAATDILIKVETGHVASLGRIGINVKDATGGVISQQEAVKRLSDLYGGQASAYSHTFAGRLATLKSESEELAEGIGFMLIPKIEGLMHATSGAIQWAEKHKTAAETLAAMIAGPVVIAMGAYLVEQGKSIALTAIQAASKLPQMFLALGATIRGTTAAEVVLNETTAMTNATMAMGAGAVGLLALKFTQLKMTQDESKNAARQWAAEQVRDIPGVQGQIDKTSKMIADQEKKVGGVHSSWLGWDKFMQQQTGTETAQQKLDALKRQQKDLENQLKVGTTPAVKEDTSAMLDLGDGTDNATGSTNAYKKAADEAKQKADEFRTSLDLLIGKNIDAEKATIAYKDQVQALGQSFVDNGKSIDINTDAGRKNRTALENVVEAAKSQIDAMVKQGATSKDVSDAFNDQVSSIKNTLTYYGYSKQQIEGLLVQYGMVPHSIETVMDLDTGNAVRSLAELKRQIDEVNKAATSNPYAATFATAGPGGVVQHRAGGGPVRAGTPYVVGENRPELFVPDRNGTIVPEVRASASSGSTYMTISNVTVSGVRDLNQLLEDLLAIARRNGNRLPVNAQAVAP